MVFTYSLFELILLITLIAAIASTITIILLAVLKSGHDADNQIMETAMVQLMGENKELKKKINEMRKDSLIKSIKNKKINMGLL